MEPVEGSICKHSRNSPDPGRFFNWPSNRPASHSRPSTPSKTITPWQPSSCSVLEQNLRSSRGETPASAWNQAGGCCRFLGREQESATLPPARREVSLEPCGALEA